MIPEKKIKPPEKKKTCDICHKVFGSAERLEHHEAVVHSIVGFSRIGTF